MSTGLAPSSSVWDLFGRGDQWQCPNSSSGCKLGRLIAFSVKCCSPTLLSQVLAVAAALRGSNPEPQSLGTTVVKMLPLGNRGGRPIEKRRGEMLPLAEQRRPVDSRGGCYLTLR